jgi:hypothetical protein
MPKLSPAAKAVLAAYLRAPAGMKPTAAAVLQAAIDQVVPESEPDLSIRRKFLAIIAELS